MHKKATHDLAGDLRDVADDLKGIVETVVVPKVGAAVHTAAGHVQAAAERMPEHVQAAADRVPQPVVDRLPQSVADHLPVTQRRGRGRTLLVLGGLAALAAGAVAWTRRSRPAPAHASQRSYPRPVDGMGGPVGTAPTDAAPPDAGVGPLDPSDPLAEPHVNGRPD